MTGATAPPAAPRVPSLSGEQERAVSALLDGVRRREPVQSLGGYAGTGKTTVIRALLDELPGAAVCAFTGKAADVLRRKGVDASTIHGLIYAPAVDVLTGEVRFRRRSSLPHPAVVVDEASMVSRDLYDDLLSFGLPLVFVGDHGQLEPVNSDFNLMANPGLTLEAIHRNAGEISRFAEWLRRDRPAHHFPAGSTGRVEFLTPGEVTERGLWAGVDQVLCAYNRTRVAVNARVRAALGRVGAPPADGERVMCLKNNRERGVFNGMQGTAAAVRRDADCPTLDLESDGARRPRLPFIPEQFGRERTIPQEPRDNRIPFDYAYCVTCHKAQGDEFGAVLVLEQRCSRWEHRRWAYTAASRARDKVYWVRDFRDF